MLHTFGPLPCSPCMSIKASPKTADGSAVEFFINNTIHNLGK